MDKTVEILTLIASILATVLAILNRLGIGEMKQKQAETHKELNSRLTQLVETVKVAEFAKGHLQGKADAATEAETSRRLREND